MAEGALFDVAKGITEKVGSLVAQEIGLLWSLKDEIEKLNGTVSTISAVIQDAEKKQQHNNQVRVWLERLNDALYEADDLLDDISTEALRRELMTRNKKAKEVRIFFSKSNQLAFGLKMGHKVKAMNERLDAIKNDKGFHLDERPIETQVGGYRVRETHSFVRTEDVIGRDKDKVEIKKFLLDPNVEGNVSILPIVGLGGLGKTTLAQYMFSDEDIEDHFEKKLWVCVSENFDVKMIVEKILQSAKDEKLKELDMDPLIKTLKEEIDGKKYLLVLDDVWNENPQKWLQLKTLLMDGAIGSRILVTTRSNKVAEITKTTQPYLLEGLDKEKSWSLFKKMAFENGQEPEKSNFKVVGRQILERCKGVPLAIRTIGSLLYFKNTEDEWLSFKDTELSKIPQEENDILPTLKLSYNHLPSHLKQCFAYCSLFPKDYKICKPTLIQMWMAQGFIRSLSPNQCLEDIGHEYFMNLFWRSFFQEVEKDFKGNILRFKMHDLMHDLAKSIAAPDSATFYSKEEGIHEKTRHVSFDRMFLSSSGIPTSLYKASRIRTFHLPSESRYQHVGLDKSTCNAIVSGFKFIRLLDLHDMGIEKIPSSIGKLKHLKYLDISYNPINMLPSSITRLHNLQTLRLFKCKIKNLPRDISKLVNLTYIDGELNLTHWRLGQLTKLQALSLCVMSRNSRRHGGLKEFNGLNKLRGTIEIELRHGIEVNIHLQDLKLSWIKGVDVSNVGYDKESLAALLPHRTPSNLQELCLIGYGEVKFPSAISSLSNLVKLSLERCNKCQHLPPLDQCHSLKTLSLKQMKDLEYISERENNGEFSDSSFLPSLEELRIQNCPNLKGWWQRQRDSVEEFHNHSLPSFPHLSYLHIWECPKLISLPLFPYLKTLSLGWMNDLEYISERENNGEFSDSSFLPSLEQLTIQNCPNLKGLWQRQRDSVEEFHNHSLPSFPHLSILAIWECPKLISLPLFPNLEELYLSKCSMKPLEQTVRMEVINTAIPKNLTSIASTSTSSSSTLAASSFIPLSKLKSMSISDMEETLPKELMCNLISLQNLTIGNCCGPLPLSQHLTALQNLTVWGSKEVDLTNDGDEMEWHGLQSLRNLGFYHVPNLATLPVGIQHLTSLQWLWIGNCPSLSAIPEWICNLTSLQTLGISGCPILLKGCEREAGEDWRKIAHIPHLDIR